MVNENPIPQPQSPGSGQSSTDATAEDSESSHSRQRRGKIARLPKNTRDQLNTMLLNSRPYAEIVDTLELEKVDINANEISKWRQNGGYDEWHKHEDWIDRVTVNYDSAKEILKEGKAATFHEANVHIAATKFYEALIGCDPDTLPTVLKEKPETFYKMVNGLSRIARDALNIQKYRETCARARDQVQQLLDPSRTLSEEERRAIIGKLDEILGLR